MINTSEPNCFYDNFCNECEKAYLTHKELSKQLGISIYTINNWKYNNKMYPNISVLRTLSDYFDVSMEYLLTGIHTFEDVTVLNLWNHLTKKQKDRIIDVMTVFFTKDSTQHDNSFFGRFFQLLDWKKISRDDFADSIGITKHTIAAWATKKDIVPDSDIVLKIARFFKVTMLYLLDGVKTVSDFPYEKWLQLTDRQQDTIKDVMSTFID